MLALAQLLAAKSIAVLGAVLGAEHQAVKCKTACMHSKATAICYHSLLQAI
jgi:hypothetical protein